VTLSPPVEDPRKATGWRRISQTIDRRWEAFKRDQRVVMLLWWLGLAALLGVALFRVRLLPAGVAARIVELLGIEPRLADAYPVIPLAAVYVVCVIASPVLAMAWPVVRWVVVAGLWLWVFHDSLLGSILGAVGGLVGYFVYRVVTEHLANQRRIIAALEKQAKRADSTDQGRG
jgi:hypothetical protein